MRHKWEVIITLDHGVDTNDANVRRRLYIMLDGAELGTIVDDAHSPTIRIVEAARIGVVA